MPRTPEDTRLISLALQGGGAHGAFTWGVLDRLLEEQEFAIEAISGTSAGAMNACALAQGLATGGRDGARAELTAFWRRISQIGIAVFNPYHATPLHALARAWNIDWTPASLWLDAMSQFVSPYQLNPLDHNPLRDLLEERIDFERLRREGAVKLFVCATNMQTNKMRIFDRSELSIDALIASSCLPQLHRAVEIDGSFYWDGGFTGNPVLKPLIRACRSRDIVLVQITPLERRKLPITASNILDRLNEVTMNAALMRELDIIATISRLVREGKISDPRYEVVRLHQIADEALMGTLGMRSKFNTAWAFLVHLRDAGIACATRWLEDNRARIGKESTLDLARFEV